MVEPPVPFSTDGCSVPGWLGLKAVYDRLFGDLCGAHDRLYWRGGTAAERRAADEAFRDGIIQRGHAVLGWAGWLAVRAGGMRILNTGHRWGYGWPNGIYGWRNQSV